MIPADSGGGGGSTDWAGYDIETLHTMTQAVTDDEISTSWQQVTAWSNTHDLLDSHASTLERYRQDLTTHWPPEKNPASAAFVGYLDQLILSLRQGSTASANNVTALANLTGAVSTARTEVQKAYQEHAKNEGKLGVYQQKLDVYTAAETDAPTPSPGPSPVPPGRQEQLTQQAQQAMAVLAGAAVDSTWKMQIPPPYTPPASATLEQREHIDTPTAVAMQPPVIPAPRISATRVDHTTTQVPGDASADGPGPRTRNGPVLTGGVLEPPSGIVTPPAPVPAQVGGGPICPRWTDRCSNPQSGRRRRSAVRSAENRRSRCR